MENKWIADRGYGSGMSLAFYGDEEFVTRSMNFAANFLLSSKAQARQSTPNFALVNTTMEELEAALRMEGYVIKLRELHAALPKARLDAEDYPADFDDRVRAYTHSLLTGANDVPDPTAYLNEPETDEMREIASRHGIVHAQAEMAKLEFDAYMRHVSQAPVACHAVIDS